jgi:hypothetical protein
VSTGGDFSDDEPPTKRQTFQHRAAKLVRDWSACSPGWQRLLEEMAASEEFRRIVEQLAAEIVRVKT